MSTMAPKAMYGVNKPLLPDLERYGKYLAQAHERAWLTNFGPLQQELTDRLEARLGVENLLLVANGSLALHLAYRVFGMDDPVLTTPFSFVATASTLAWEGKALRFGDIDPRSFNLSLPNNDLDEPIGGVVAVHVYGNPCDVEAIEHFGKERRIPIIYDAAHCMGSTYDGESVLRWGDAATLSFHATKVFHTVEGGAIVFRRKEDLAKAKQLMNFGLDGSGRMTDPGTNMKMSEYHAAAGLVLLEDFDEVLSHRRELKALYQDILRDWVEFQVWHERGEDNAAYMPILASTSRECVALETALSERGIGTRRYFFPSLNRLPFLGAGVSCPVSEDISSRILCLPLYADLQPADVRIIAEEVKGALTDLRR